MLLETGKPGWQCARVSRYGKIQSEPNEVYNNFSLELTASTVAARLGILINAEIPMIK